MYKHLVRPLLFKFNSEGVHNTAMSMARLSSLSPCHFLAQTVCGYRGGRLDTEFLGRKIAQPIGLAAGFDKDAIAVPFFKSLGFSLVELGSVTLKQQPGNPKPRIFRCSRDEALVNRMGFPSVGLPRFLENFDMIKKYQLPEIVGINIGKNKDTPLENAAREYAACLSGLGSRGDYYVVNVSSPNTADLRTLQQASWLREIITALHEQNLHNKPLFVKIAPDLSFKEIDSILEILLEQNITGVVATNTTSSREGLKKDPNQQGGMSGRPLFAKSLDVVEHIYRSTGGRLSIVGVGGISSGSDVWNMLSRGASCVQIYTALIFQGPLLVKHWCNELEVLMEKHQLSSLSQLKGSGLSS